MKASYCIVAVVTIFAASSSAQPNLPGNLGDLIQQAGNLAQSFNQPAQTGVSNQEIQQAINDAKNDLAALAPAEASAINAFLNGSYTDFLSNWTNAWAAALNGSDADFQKFLNQLSATNWTTYTNNFLPGLLNSSYLNDTYTGLYMNSTGDFNALLQQYTSLWNGTLTKQQSNQILSTLDDWTEPLSNLLEGYGMVAVGTAQLLRVKAINGSWAETITDQLNFLNASLVALNSSIVDIYNETGMSASDWLASVRQQVSDYDKLINSLGNNTEQVKLASWAVVQNGINLVQNASVEVFGDCNGLQSLVYGYVAGNLTSPLYSELVGTVAGGQAVVTALEGYIQSATPSVSSTSVTSSVRSCAATIMNTSLINGVPSNFKTQVSNCKDSADAYLQTTATDGWENAYNAINNALDNAFGNVSQSSNVTTIGTIWGFAC